MMNTGSYQNKTVHHRCVECRKPFAHGFTPLCDACDHLIEVEYDLAGVTFHDSPNSLTRYFDLLPIENPDNMLPIELTKTPCLHARALGASVGLPRLFLKNETVLPTRSTKARMAAVALSFLRECGIREFCTSSTGNSSSAFAYMIRQFPKMKIHLFTAEDFRRRVQYTDHDQVNHYVLRGASFVDAFQCAGDFAQRRQLTAERGFFNPSRREGLKLAFFEASEQIPGPIDWYVQAVSSGMGVYGTYKGAKELLALNRISRLPRLLCVQQASCRPMVHAYQDGETQIRPQHIVERPSGIAESILRGDPTRAYPYMRKTVIDSNGTFVSVDEQAIRDARKRVQEHEGLDPCFSASTALAGLIKQVREDRFPRNDTVLVNLTGADRDASPGPEDVCWLTKTAAGHWEPETAADPRWNEAPMSRPKEPGHDHATRNPEP